MMLALTTPSGRETTDSVFFKKTTTVSCHIKHNKQSAKGWSKTFKQREIHFNPWRTTIYWGNSGTAGKNKITVVY